MIRQLHRTRFAQALMLGAGLTLAVTGCTDDVTSEQHEIGAPAAADRYIVKYTPGNGAAARAAANGQGGEVVLELAKHNAFAAYLPAAAVNGLSNNPAIDFIEEDQLRRPLAYDDEQVTPWGITEVLRDGVDAQPGDPIATFPDFPADADPIKVCIIDSGFDAAHLDAWDGAVSGTNTRRSRRRGAGGGTIPWNEDTCGHGTHVAGTIAAADNSQGVIGLAPFANIKEGEIVTRSGIALHIIRVFEGEDCGWTFSSSLVKALELCEDAGADVVNMSLGGGGRSDTEEAAFDAAYANGVFSIAAAGNEEDETQGVAISYPASYLSVMSVAAVAKDDQVAYFSNQNEFVEISGPGVSVLSTVPSHQAVLATLSTGQQALPMDGSVEGTATGVLVDCQLGESQCPSVAGDFICLIQRGTISFADKVNNCDAAGGQAAIIYNNVPGELSGTFGTTAVSIPGVGVSDTSGVELSALPSTTVVTLDLVTGNVAYSFYDGTSMACPHVAGVAALAWSQSPGCSVDQVRAALVANARPLGDAELFGAGMVQARAAADDLLALNCSPRSTTCEVTESSETSCSDGLDNDCDGNVDSADSDCGSSPPPDSCDIQGASCTPGSNTCCNKCKGNTRTCS